jgi:uncharacterized protein involved in exopolysaccharide biosynthesis
MHSHEAEAPRGIITELRAALDAVPADEPRNYLRQSLQLLVLLLEQMHQRLQALEARLEAFESKAAQKLHQFLSFAPTAQRYGSLATTSVTPVGNEADLFLRRS